MRRFLWRWVFLAVAIVLAAKVTKLVVGGFDVIPIKTAGDVFTIMLGAAALGLINATVGRIVRFLALPLTCLTLGLFALVINAALLMLAGSLGLGFQVDNWVAALVGSTAVAVINAVLGTLIPDERKDD